MKYDFKIRKMIINEIEMKSIDYNTMSKPLHEKMKIELEKLL